MSKTYSAHPARALEQLQCAELVKNQHATQIQHRRQTFANSNKYNTSRKTAMPPKHELPDIILSQKTLPDRTISNNKNDDDIDTIANYAVIDEDDLTDDTITKDCINCASIAVVAAESPVQAYDDEPDALQQHYIRTNIPTPMTLTSTTTTTATPIPTDMTSHEDRRCESPYRALNRHHLSQLQQHLARDMDGVGCLSGVSSAISSPSASTVSTPLSTPTRLTPHHQIQQQKPHKHNHHCCQHKSLSLAGNAGIETGAAGTATTTTTTTTATTTTETTPTSTNMQQYKHPHHHNHHLHHHHHQFHQPTPSANNGCKKIKKFDPRLGPSPYRQLLPIALCILSFAVVFSLLIIYMDTTGELSDLTLVHKYLFYTY